MWSFPAIQDIVTRDAQLAEAAAALLPLSPTVPAVGEHHTSALLAPDDDPHLHALVEHANKLPSSTLASLRDTEAIAAWSRSTGLRTQLTAVDEVCDRCARGCSRAVLTVHGRQHHCVEL